MSTDQALTTINKAPGAPAPAPIPDWELRAMGPAVRAYSPLMTFEDLPALIEALEDALLPAPEDAVRQSCAMIVGSFPQAQPGAPEIYTGGMLQELSEFPADILEATVREVRRTLKFLPAISEVYEIADKLRRERQRFLGRAQKAIADHARRIEDAKLERRREEEREKWARQKAAEAVCAFIRRLGAQQESEDWVLMMEEIRRGATQDEIDAFVMDHCEGKPEALERGQHLLEAAKARRTGADHQEALTADP